MTVEMNASMLVTKSDGSTELFDVAKLKARVESVSSDLDLNWVRLDKIVEKVKAGLYDRVPTVKIDELLAETAAYLSPFHPDYSLLGGRLAVTALYNHTDASFSATMRRLADYVNHETGKPAPLVARDCIAFIEEHASTFDNAIVSSRDFGYDYFGYKTLEKSYLLRMNGKVAERPQHLLMRVACALNLGHVEDALETYDLLSRRMYTHATPTLFNAGTPKPQLSSCFLVNMSEDSITGIYDTLKVCAQISQHAGGIGLSISKIRAKGSYIAGTNGTSNGIVPMLRVYNDTARYVDQGGGRRKGSFAIYLEPWHSDVFDFLDLKKNTGKDEMRARDLFYALWIPDLFMKRVEANADWSLFCPNEAPGLYDSWGAEFEKLYTAYEKDGRARRTVKAQELWFAILESQIETGTPYMLYKDACNRKSNQQHLGTIYSSNLCTEIIQYSSPDEVAVCNLASIALPRFVKNGEFDHAELARVTRVVVRNLNRVIDINYYPVEAARRSNTKHRPIGLGVQGLADVFMMLRLSFESDAARSLNREIFETLYYASLQESCACAAKDGPFATYDGCPVSKGILQFDMWEKEQVKLSGRWNWDALRQEIAKFGVRNSLLVAPMPTASTSQILGNNECFEPYTSNIYLRRVLAGEFPVVNQHLVRDLIRLGLWNEMMRTAIIAANGSVQQIQEIPAEIREIYKTAWEIKQRRIVEYAADRGCFIDQSQSLNIFMAEPTHAKLTSMHFVAWKMGLKTGMYYLRTRPAADAIKFTVQTPTKSVPVEEKDKKEQEIKNADGSTTYVSEFVCRRDDPNCLMCSS